jgi:hypothetical protein
VEEPSQVTLHLPWQVTVQTESPVQETLLPSPASSMHFEVPWHVMVVPAPPEI